MLADPQDSEKTTTICETADERAENLGAGANQEEVAAEAPEAFNGESHTEKKKSGTCATEEVLPADIDISANSEILKSNGSAKNESFTEDNTASERTEAAIESFNVPSNDENVDAKRSESKVLAPLTVDTTSSECVLPPSACTFSPAPSDVSCSSSSSATTQASDPGARHATKKISPPSGSLRRPAKALDSPTIDQHETTSPLFQRDPDLRTFAYSIIKGIKSIPDTDVDPSGDDDDLAMDAAKELAIKVKEVFNTAEKLTDMMHLLHEKSLRSESFATKTAILFGCLSQLEIDGVRCRNIFLKRIQQDFVLRAEIRRRDAASFSHLVTLLCQVFRRVRVADGTTISALAGPIFDSLADLMQAPLCDHAASAFSKTVQVIGVELRRINTSRFDVILLDMRRALVQSVGTEGLSSTGVAMLLLALEVVGSNWKLADAVEQMYASLLLPGCRLRSMEVSRPPAVATSVQPPPAIPTVPPPPVNISPEVMQSNLARLAALAMVGETDLNRPPPLPFAAAGSHKPGLRSPLPDMSVPPPNLVRFPPAKNNAISRDFTRPTMRTQTSWGSSSNTGSDESGTGGWGQMPPSNSVGGWGAPMERAAISTPDGPMRDYGSGWSTADNDDRQQPQQQWSTNADDRQQPQQQWSTNADSGFGRRFDIGAWNSPSDGAGSRSRRNQDDEDDEDSNW